MILRARRHVPVVAGWMALYAAAMLVGLATRIDGSGFALAWPAAAVSVAWLLSTRGFARRAGVVLLVTATTVLLNGLAGVPWPFDLLFGLVNAVHATVGVVVLSLLGWRSARPARELRDLAVLAAAATAAGLAGALLGGAAAVLDGEESVLPSIALVGARNAASTFVGVVMLLAVPWLRRAGGRAGATERIALVTATLVATAVVMESTAPVLFLMVPLTVAVAMRCGPYVASVIAGSQAVFVVLQTVRGHGQLAEVASTELRVVLAHVLTVVLVLVGLVLALEGQERRQALERSREVHDRLVDHLDAALVANAHLLLDTDGRLHAAAVNPALADLCRTDRPALLAADPLAWFDTSDRAVVDAAVDDLRGGRSLAWRGELRMAEEFGGGWVDAALSPVGAGTAGRDLAVNLQLLDITGRKRAEERLANLALHDQLTGLPNRALVTDRLGVALAQARRTGLRLAVLYVDVDRFKQVNDTRGHDAGDRLLQQFAGRLSAVARAHDTVARLGGDEFVLVCPAVGTPEQARAVATRVLDELAAPFDVDGERVLVSASVGIAMSDGHEDDVREVLRRADTALYSAKDRGRSRFEVFNAEDHADAERSVRLLEELRRAFEFGELVMEYQPIVALDTRRTVGLEALVRWRHPDRGLLAPAAFLPVIESSDLVFQLGELAVRQACHDGAAFLAAGHPLAMHVNLSARELERSGTVDNVRSVLAESGFPPELLTLEVTETRMLTVSRSLLRDLADLRRLGVRIAVDDFGTGYSGPAHLVQMPVDVLKLDRGFVAGIEEQRSAQAVSSGVLAMARGLGVGLIAEGVETEEQAAALVRLGYEHGQGFLFGRAMPARQVPEWLGAHAAV